MNTFEKLYNKNYKKLLILPISILLLSIVFISLFYIQTGGIFNGDISLTGGTTITLFTEKSVDELSNFLENSFEDFDVQALSDNTGTQNSLTISISEEKTTDLIEKLEEFLGETLDSNDYSIETTSSSLSSNFFKQLIIAVVLAFFWMAAVVFLIFVRGKKIKLLSLTLNIILGILLGNLFSNGIFLVNLISIGILMISLIYLYIKNSIPSCAVMLSAFSNVVMTLAVVDFIGMKVSSAGIVAFLMLIGYSVDTDIMLTTRLLKRKNSVNKELVDAFKTGLTMTLTSMAAVIVALIIVAPFGSVLNQIFSILIIGLGFDLVNTWILNASILKWFVEGKK